MLAAIAGAEAGLVFAIRGPYAKGVEWPLTFMGILATVMLIGGYIPIPFEMIPRRGRAKGINFLFLALDSSGAFFSLMSLGKLEAPDCCALLMLVAVAQNTFDVLFGTLYTLW